MNHSWEMASTFVEDTLEELHLDEVGEGVNRELDLMKSFPVYHAVPRAEVTGKVWSTHRCYRKKGPTQVRARFVVRQFAISLDANFYSPTAGLEVTRVLLAVALSKDLTILCGDIGVAFLNTPMPEGDPVYHSARNQFERFRGFLELIRRFEFEFCRPEIFFLTIRILVCPCECAVACLCPRNSISNVVVSLTTCIYIYIYKYVLI